MKRRSFFGWLLALLFGKAPASACRSGVSARGGNYGIRVTVSNAACRIENCTFIGGKGGVLP